MRPLSYLIYRVDTQAQSGRERATEGSGENHHQRAFGVRGDTNRRKQRPRSLCRPHCSKSHNSRFSLTMYRILVSESGTVDVPYISIHCNAVPSVSNSSARCRMASTRAWTRVPVRHRPPHPQRRWARRRRPRCRTGRRCTGCLAERYVFVAMIPPPFSLSRLPR